MINVVRKLSLGSSENVRSTTAPQDNAFDEILREKVNKKMTAKEYLRTLSRQELDVLRDEQRLASEINIGGLSDEGAENLFVARNDKRHYKDLNNDGIVEIGAGKSFIFPPANAPESVKDAWDKTVANMTLGERVRAEAPFLVEQLKANIREMPNGCHKVLSPGDEGYCNAFGDSVGFYRGMINAIKAEKEEEFKNAGPEARKNIEFSLKVLGQFLDYLVV